MRLFRNLFLLISGCIVFFGCSPRIPNGFYPTESSQKVLYSPYFQNEELDYIYKTSIEVYGHNFGGILIIKKLGDNNFRTVLTTEFGNKLFDFQFDKENFKVHFILEQMNRKLVVNTLRRDLGLLIRDRFLVDSYYKAKDSELFLSKEGKYVYFIFSADDRIETISVFKGRKKKNIITFDSPTQGFPEKVKIQHQKIKLLIDLNSVTLP